jgi:cystathionine gamma-synthase
LGHGLDGDIDLLEGIIAEELERNPGKPPLLGLFTELPSNPLLRSVNLPRLRALAHKHDFLIVVDETIGNYVNVDVLPYADIVVSSLTKVFSGASNVMGGRYIHSHFDVRKRTTDLIVPQSGVEPTGPPLPGFKGPPE